VQHWEHLCECKTSKLRLLYRHSLGELYDLAFSIDNDTSEDKAESRSVKRQSSCLSALTKKVIYICIFLFIPPIKLQYWFQYLGLLILLKSKDSSCFCFYIYDCAALLLVICCVKIYGTIYNIVLVLLWILDIFVFIKKMYYSSETPNCV
jgi:hypothetical protein